MDPAHEDAEVRQAITSLRQMAAAYERMAADLHEATKRLAAVAEGCRGARASAVAASGRKLSDLLGTIAALGEAARRFGTAADDLAEGAAPADVVPPALAYGDTLTARVEQDHRDLTALLGQLGSLHPPGPGAGSGEPGAAV